MAAVKHAIHEHDVVALRHAVDRDEGAGQWPAGTEGTVVSELGEHRLIEISNERGEALDFVSQPETELALLARHGRQAAAPE